MVSRKLKAGPAKTVSGAFPHRLRVEGDLLLVVGQRFDLAGVRRARRVHVADEFHVAAERNGGNLPARAVAVVEADEFGTEADRERLDADAAPAADEVVAHLVHEHDDRQHEQERDDRADQQAVRAEETLKVYRSSRFLKLAGARARRQAWRQYRGQSGQIRLSTSDCKQSLRGLVGAAEHRADGV